jgi:exodeoxyribonuclease VII large subunit
LDQLHNNPHKFVFYTRLIPAVMQGNEAPRSITNALELIYQYEDFFDVVVIIRGGGAQLDLACFDQYELAFNVAQFPLPVITGIGHEKDDTVVDLVAHTRMKTPTAVAEFLISGALQFSQQLNELEQHFTELISDQLDDHKNRLTDAADQLNLLVTQLIAKQTSRLEIAQIQLANQSAIFLKNQLSYLKQLTTDTKNQTNRFVTRQNHQLIQSGNKLNYSFRKQILNGKNLLNNYQSLVRMKTLEQLKNEKKNIGLISEKLRLVDPQNILKRGYSLTMLNGKILKSVHLAQKGDLLETLLRDGTIESTVEKAVEKGK